MLRFILILLILFFSLPYTFSQRKTSESTLIEFKKLNSQSVISFDNREIERFINIYIKQIELLSKIRNNDSLKFLFFQSRAMYFNRMELHEESTKNGQKALNLFIGSNLTKNNNLLIEAYCIYGNLAGNYIRTNSIDNATEEYKKAVDFSIKYNINDLFKASALNNLGIHFSENLKQSDSALFYFKAADKIMQKLPDNLQSFRGSIIDNIANVHFDKNEFELANKLYYKNFKFYFPETYLRFKSEKEYSVRDFERWFKAGLQAAETDVKLKKIKSAEKTLNIIDSLLLTYDFVKKERSRRDYFKILEKLYTAKLNDQKAAFYSKKSKALSDSINRIDEANQSLWNIALKENLINHLKGKFELQQLQTKNENQKERFRFWLALIILLVIIAGTSFIIIIHKQRLKILNKTKLITENKLQLTLLKSEFLNKEINSKKKDLSDFALNLSQNLEWTEEFYTKFKQLETLKGRSKGKELQRLENDVKNRITFNNTTKDFYNKIETLSNKFYSSLLEQYPNLTNAEIKLCAMIRLGIDNYGIGTLHSIHQNSVHQKRYRLKKKLNLEVHQNLDLFLKRF